MSLFSELKRRNVIRVGAAYIVVAWLIIQVAETLFPLFGFGDGPARIVVIVLAIGFVPVLIISWAFELTPDGLKRDSDVDPEFSIAPQSSLTAAVSVRMVRSRRASSAAIRSSSSSSSRRLTSCAWSCASLSTW